jgi:alkyl-hydroperoxide reductase/thiol specific antioxidant family protein
LREYEDQFRARAVKVVAIGLGGTDYARHFREQTGITFPLLIDENRQSYKVLELKKANLLHLFRGDNMKARKRAKAIGVRQHKLGKDPFQLGGSFVFAPGNKDLFAHISETFGDNAQPRDWLTAIG